ncbi:hypothetical protein B0I35DRAFT_476891 [Stachybotrys elegans]|uniref:Zn(2)-C6 fungal-type domain-containing protein n=1 Tax=Stachybotrys elegans TaxID=80388 RepID=A0A8K0WT24_9HYPO|nr:hypothetical protein B0I35DRAFT_476891 [Stachybotrys elegans]
MDSGAGFQVFSLRSENHRVREYKRRREHKKTKLGCIACRAKKVKCDETRPVCLRCSRNKRECVYETPEDGSESDHAGGQASAAQTTAGLSSLAAPTLDPSFSPGSDNGTDDAQLWQNLQQYEAELFQMKNSSTIIAFSQGNSLLNHVLLALSACHLRQQTPGSVQHRIAEHFQQSEALHEFQQALDTPRQDLGEQGVSVLILSAILLGQITFALPASETADDEHLDPRSSWVFDQGDSQLGWLDLQVGLHSLIASVAPYGGPALDFVSSIFIQDREDTWWGAQGERPLRAMPSTWAHVLHFDNEIPVHSQASALLDLRDTQPVAPNVFKALIFLGDIDQNFRQLLNTKDERALWMLGYWFGLLSRFEDVWWTRQRARRDHQAILMWLQQLNLGGRPGPQGQAWQAMMHELELAPRAAWRVP